MTFSNGPMSSLQKGCTQPPNLKSLVGSSSGPPGACMTPSSDWKTAPVSLRIDRFAFERGLDLGDVDFLHRHHRLERPLGSGLAGVAQGIEQVARRDLPRVAPLVLAPDAGALLAVPGDRIPIAIRFGLVLGHDHEADGLVGLEVGAAVEAQEGVTEESELNRQLLALMTAGKIARS